MGRCRLCHNARSLDDCLRWTECDENQACFMEEIFDEGLQKLYNGGCRALDVCQGPSSGRRREILEDGTKRDVLVACSKCCNQANYCNEKLCGIKRATDLPMCNQCDGAKEGNHAVLPQYPDNCKVQTICQADEMCFASTNTHGDSSLRHYTSCRKASECVPLVRYILQLAEGAENPTAVGKRDRQICAMCCGDDMCNNIACEAIKGRLINL